MPTYYEILNIQPDATPNEITTAYRQLARECHPDKAPDKADEFLALQEAYEVLRDLKKRCIYNVQRLHAPKDSLAKFKGQRIKVILQDAPDTFTHYEYFNQLFALEDDERLVPGDNLSTDTWYARGIDVEITMGKAIDRYRRQAVCNGPLDASTKQRKAFLCINQHKVCIATFVLVSFPLRKALYDATLHVYHTPAIIEIIRNMGGESALMHAINKDASMNFADGVFALQEANCLTPGNFNTLIQCEYGLSHSLTSLQAAGLLNQANFNLLTRYLTYVKDVSAGINGLEHADILTQDYFEAMVRAGRRAAKVGCHLMVLQQCGWLNHENAQAVIHRFPYAFVLTRALSESRLNEHFTEEEASAILLWTGPDSIHTLHHALNEMFAHGLFLLSTATPEKGREAMLLALRLKNDLKAFMALPEHAQVAQAEQFKQQFLTSLHSRDEIMSIHRAYWKIIVTNIAIALTGIGLFALGINYCVTGHCFFNQTASEQHLDTIESAFEREAGTFLGH